MIKTILKDLDTLSKYLQVEINPLLFKSNKTKTEKVFIKERQKFRLAINQIILKYTMQEINIHGIPFEKGKEYQNVGTRLSYFNEFFTIHVIIAPALSRFICSIRVGCSKVLQVEPIKSNTHITEFACFMSSDNLEDSIYAVLSTVNDYGIAELKELQNTFLENYRKAKEVEEEEAVLGKVATLEEIKSITYPLDLYD